MPFGNPDSFPNRSLLKHADVGTADLSVATTAIRLQRARNFDCCYFICLISLFNEEGTSACLTLPCAQVESETPPYFFSYYYFIAENTSCQQLSVCYILPLVLLLPSDRVRYLRFN